MEKPDWFKMNPAQFLQDGIVDAMTALELGAALRLLCRQWIDGDLADDKALLARQARLTEEEMERAWQVLSQFFQPLDNGRRANRFMWVERQAVAAKCESKSDAFRALARRRWDHAKKGDDQLDADDLESNAARNAARMSDAMQEKSREEQSRDTPKASPSAFAFPEWLPLDTWNAFVEMRKKERHPLTAGATKLAISKLETLRASGNDVGAVLENSILGGYRGLFPVNGNGATEKKSPLAGMKFANGGGQ